jgi:hypothetical protein
MLRTLLIPLALLAVAVALAPAAAEPARDTPLDKAVDRALVFLQNNQERDGSWKSRGASNPAVTSLAVMAFLSAGHVPGEGRYGEVVEKGIRWVLKRQHDNGLIATEGHHEMYHHGISTLMLAEAAGMTQGELAKELRARLVKAVQVIKNAQCTKAQPPGGWDYVSRPTQRSDMSLTGWQIMALRGAKNLGCDVPAETIDRAISFVKKCQDNRTGGFGYMPGGFAPTIACTGTGILALEVCGKDQHLSAEVLKAGGYLIKNPPHWNGPYFYYSIYYCSQAGFQLGDNYWKVLRKELHSTLLGRQLDNGSWVGGGTDADNGAPYCTAMAVLALTVEYRYLPIYQRGEEPGDKEK